MENIEVIAAINTLALAPIYFIINGLKSDIKEIRNKLYR